MRTILQETLLYVSWLGYIPADPKIKIVSSNEKVTLIIIIRYPNSICDSIYVLTRDVQKIHSSLKKETFIHVPNLVCYTGI